MKYTPVFKFSWVILVTCSAVPGGGGGILEQFLGRYVMSLCVAQVGSPELFFFFGFKMGSREHIFAFLKIGVSGAKI